MWVANHYMSLFGRLRLGIKSERIEVSIKEEIQEQVSETPREIGPRSQRASLPAAQRETP